jgi:hypothetical protein
MPVGERKSGTPLSVETPAPVRTTQGWFSRMSSASFSIVPSGRRQGVSCQVNSFMLQHAEGLQAVLEPFSMFG